MMSGPAAADLPPFGRDFWGSEERLSAIGGGRIGGKAAGLAFVQQTLCERFEGQDDDVAVTIPRGVVLGTDVFDAFVERNGLGDIEARGLTDDRVAHAFLNADLPAEHIGDLRALIESVHTPLAVRSSSLLEDAMFEPFAGVYATKMIPNNQHSADVRFRKLIEAVKLVFASTYFQDARDYRRTTRRAAAPEKMAVLLQEVVGSRYGDRFYPHLSGVARSYSFYPTGRAKPEEGVVDLALGLGKTIVDGGLTWSYSPAYPRVSPPVASPAELFKRTQTELWAVNMGEPAEHDPIRETEHLCRASLADAEADGTLRQVASTFRVQDDRLVIGTFEAGPRLITFAPLLALSDSPFNDLMIELVRICEQALGTEVEIEIAANLGSAAGGRPIRLGLLQVRPMVVSDEQVELSDDELRGERVLIASEQALGNGVITGVRDVVYVRPEAFAAGHTRAIAKEIEGVNRRLLDEHRPYLLIGFGRWGSSDPWLGIPVTWPQICGARVIVEATLAGKMNVDMSQGSHFFHNLTSFSVCYLAVPHQSQRPIGWDWLAAQPEELCTDHLRHVRLSEPLCIKVDGRRGRAVIGFE